MACEVYDTTAAPPKDFLLNNRRSLNLAVQRALDSGTSLNVVSKVINRDLKDGERHTFAELIPEWMKKHQCSFCAMETADVILTHENFMSSVHNRAFKDVNTNTLYQGPVSPRAIAITNELFGIAERHRVEFGTTINILSYQQ